MQPRPVFFRFYGKFYTLVSFYFIFIRNGRNDRHNRLYDNDEHDKYHSRYPSDKHYHTNHHNENVCHDFRYKIHRFNHYDVYLDFHDQPQPGNGKRQGIRGR